MPDPDPKPVDPRSLKIFPRNLTARADAVVRGNPTNSRPEASVENCFPGLEIDIRNLEQNFVPGLHFEYHRGDGAILARIELDDRQRASGLTESDCRAAATGKPRLYLWALMGHTAADDREPTLFGLRGQGGLEVFRRVRDLRPGRVSVVFGPTPGFNADYHTYPNSADPESPIDPLDEMAKAFGATTDADSFKVFREDGSGEIRFAVFAQDRNRYLDDDGVIDVGSYQPGELTKTLCAPWVYDFRDCSCFYWSSNKPDLVDSADGKFHFLDFMRKDRTSVPPPQDVTVYRGRRDLELTYEDMVEGGWESILPVVLNDRESVSFTPAPAPDVTDLLDEEELVGELVYLATVEHALTVEYLYAYFSLNAPLGPLPAGAGSEDVRIFTAAQELFTIAVEEMRHFRWVNEVLSLLGRPPSTDRAERIGAPPRAGDGRKSARNRKFLDTPFALKPLTPATLQWFIDVEAPSQAANEQLDGMYVEILASLDRQPDLFQNAALCTPIIKLIVDEGGGHFERFLRIRETLDGIAPGRYLHTFQSNPGPTEQALMDLCDEYYHSIIDAIRITFSMGNRSGGVLLNAAVRSMFNLNEAAFVLTARGFAPGFNLPAAAPLRNFVTHDEAQGMLDARAASLEAALDQVKAVGAESERMMADRQIAANRQLYERFRQIVRQGFDQP